LGQSAQQNQRHGRFAKWRQVVCQPLPQLSLGRVHALQPPDRHWFDGADYLYTYMRTFYRDETKATGWNNLVFPNVGMPHVLWELQGVRRPIFEERDEHGHKVQVFKGWEQVTPGTLTPQQYDQAMADLVGYLQWMGEPAQNQRVRLGMFVMLFLLGFMYIAWRLNASFWKDIK
jgi:ubiquinol-cytochrome c reductase cytochrome c1 subunit